MKYVIQIFWPNIRAIILNPKIYFDEGFTNDETTSVHSKFTIGWKCFVKCVFTRE